MKKSDVRIGGVYEVRVSGKLARVRIDSEITACGWTATNLDTGRSVRVRTAGRLRKPVRIAPPTSVGNLWRQWQALKASNPGTVLLFRVGEDRFEAYGDDATVCMKVLGLAVTRRRDSLEPGHYAETSLAGFPAADLEANIGRLVTAGFRVAICERVQVGAVQEFQSTP